LIDMLCLIVWLVDMLFDSLIDMLFDSLVDWYVVFDSLVDWYVVFDCLVDWYVVFDSFVTICCSIYCDINLLSLSWQYNFFIMYIHILHHCDMLWYGMYWYIVCFCIIWWQICYSAGLLNLVWIWWMYNDWLIDWLTDWLTDWSPPWDMILKHFYLHLCSYVPLSSSLLHMTTFTRFPHQNSVYVFFLPCLS
jgi:hypothetical protein